MLGYIVKRVLLSLLALAGVALITFLAVYATGDPATLLLPPGNQSPEEVAAMRRALGLDRPLPVQFIDFLVNAVQGDFGRSLRYSQPAIDLVFQRLPATLVLAAIASILAAVIAIPTGIYAAIRQGSWIDNVLVAVSTLGLATPTFWTGTMLILVFAVQFRLLPASGSGTPLHLVMPALTLATVSIPVLMRFTRSGMIDVLSREYIVAARAKGLPPSVIRYRHAFRNALVPLVTLLGLEFGALIGGAVITETVFAYPGLGNLLVQAVLQRDIPVVLAAVIVCAAAFIIINLIVDLLYLYISPTVRLK